MNFNYFFSYFDSHKMNRKPILTILLFLGFFGSFNAQMGPNDDFDGDGIINSLDLDDDNDGILDCIERGYSQTASVDDIFKLNGSATEINSKQIRLTQAITYQSGQAWSNGKVDFSKSFVLRYEANLGANDNGADGIATVFHNSPLGVNAVGGSGSGMGANGIQNGIVLEIDTYQNGAAEGDIANDHGQIWVSSNQSGAGLLTTAADLGQLEDNVWREVVITWNFTTKTLSYTVGGINAGSYTFPASTPITSYFGGASKVFFGYTASTGGSINEQSVRFTDFCSQLPLELDTNADGLNNEYDRDSDSDGCPDAIEGDKLITQSMINANGSIAGGVDANGIPLAATGGQGIGNAYNAAVSDCRNTGLCSSGCNGNAYVNSTTPNTIEYDNMVSVFHSSMVKESDGKVKVWGQGIAFNGTGQTNNVLIPQEMNSTTYPGLTGTILKIAAGSNSNNQQFAVLTTTGLFVWGGATGSLINPTIKSTNVFGSVAIGTSGVTGTKSDGLPAGVLPADVKMMFGTRNTLAIVTCSGAAWMLSNGGSKNGDGTTVTDAVWHRVKINATTDLNNVVAMRGTLNAMFALTSDGELYTWGTGSRIGGTSDVPTNRSFATLMSKPAGITIKMIGMTNSTSGQSYFLLATNGNLYSLGENESRQLGIFSTVDSNVWVRVQRTAAAGDFLTNVVWISPQEHEGGNYAAINILTADGKLWAWGNNNNSMLGATGATVDPTLMPGSITGAYDATKLNSTDTLIAVETGGHTTLIIKQCSTKFGYVGHRISGSMANNSSGSGTETVYNFGDTAPLSICGALAGPAVTDLKICTGTLANLQNAQPSSLPPGVTTIEWWTTITRDSGTQLTNITAVPPGTYYAFYSPLVVSCPTTMTVSYYLPTDVGNTNNCVCYNPAITPGTGPETKMGITLLKRASSADNWPMGRKSGHIVLESNSKGFVVSRVTTAGLSAITTPQEGMMVYDTTARCLKIYSDGAWTCFNNPACP
ncbi:MULTISPECIES: lectin-like domain-containing protein [Chryseobacterium]|nr:MULTISPECIES: hypothetical protein [Chryseobacterium]